jgi:hypothetical protein
VLHPDDGGDVPPKHQFLLQQPHGITSQKMAFFSVKSVAKDIPKKNSPADK